METSKSHSKYTKAKPYIGVILLQCGLAGMDILSKVALNHGMSNYVLVVYRHAVATIVVAPFAIFLDRYQLGGFLTARISLYSLLGGTGMICLHLSRKRKLPLRPCLGGISERKKRPKMTKSIFMKLLLLSLLEPVIDQNLYYLGMKYTSATFVAAMVNVLPAITFVMAWLLRLEMVNWRSIHSQAKIIGTIATVGGAMMMTLVKGPLAFQPFWFKHGGITYDHDVTHNDISLHAAIKASILVTIGCFSWSAFLILQVMTLKSYPSELSMTAWICVMGTLENVVVALIMEKGRSSVWAIGWDANLLAAVYSGIFCSGLLYYLQGVIMKERGPVFVTAFNPLCMVIVAVLSTILMAENMYLGRLIGAIIIVAGLYMVLWGKGKDYDTNIDEHIQPQHPENDPNNTISRSLQIDHTL